MATLSDEDDRSEPSKERAHWSESEISVAVHAYFQMLEHESASRPYVKAAYNRDVQALTGRSHGAVEYKFQNISHVLNEAGSRYIEGYKPARNAQTALKSAVLDRIHSLASMKDLGAGQQIETFPPDEALIQAQRQRYAGICLDPVLRKAIELSAVQQAAKYYESQGYEVEDVGLTRSYDLHAVRDDEERHIEVKGSQGRIEKILLTRNEVSHASRFNNTDLVLVQEVPWERDVDGTVSSGEGLMAVLRNWRPGEGDLTPMSYECVVNPLVFALFDDEIQVELGGHALTKVIEPKRAMSSCSRRPRR